MSKFITAIILLAVVAIPMYSQEQSDTLKAQELNEGVVEATMQQTGAQNPTYIPTSKQKNVSRSGMEVTLTTSAQEEKRPFTVTLYGGIYLNNEQAWTIEPSVAWHFHKYIGVAFGMELTSQYNQPSRSTTINGHEASLADNEKDVAWIVFKPSVIFKTPNLLKNKDDIRLWLQAEPGISLACPFRNSLTYEIYDIKGNVGTVIDYMRFPNRGLNWFYWNTRLSVNMSIDRIVIGAGYGVSNLDYYSGRRNVMLQNGSKFRVPQKELSQSIFLMVGYKF